MTLIAKPAAPRGDAPDITRPPAQEPLLDSSLSHTLSLAWRFIREKNQRTPDQELPTAPVNLDRFTSDAPGVFSSTWLGHSSVMINLEGMRLMLDPVLDSKVSVVGPSRFNGPSPLTRPPANGTAPINIPALDLIIISHDHYDHLNRASIRQLKDKTRHFAVPEGIGPILACWGVPKEKITELAWWESFEPAPGFKIIATPSQHFSGRGIFDRNKTLWASWVIQSPGHRLFFSGDSGYFDGFAAIGRKYGPFDMTFLECGAYDPGWSKVHMFPEETVRAHQNLQGKILHPIHWGTFNLALHPWYDPMVRLRAAAETAGVPIATPVPGQTVDMTDLGGPWWTALIATGDKKEN